MVHPLFHFLNWNWTINMSWSKLNGIGSHKPCKSTLGRTNVLRKYFKTFSLIISALINTLPCNGWRISLKCAGSFSQLMCTQVIEEDLILIVFPLHPIFFAWMYVRITAGEILSPANGSALHKETAIASPHSQLYVATLSRKNSFAYMVKKVHYFYASWVLVNLFTLRALQMWSHKPLQDFLKLLLRFV